MSRNEPTELFIALHVSKPTGAAVLVSIDGDNSKAKWIPKSLIESITETGDTTQGTGRHGQKEILPLALLVIPEWLAIREELV